jgi:hypothetical protein
LSRPRAAARLATASGMNAIRSIEVDPTRLRHLLRQFDSTSSGLPGPIGPASAAGGRGQTRTRRAARPPAYGTTPPGGPRLRSTRDRGHRRRGG